DGPSALGTRGLAANVDHVRALCDQPLHVSPGVVERDETAAVAEAVGCDVDDPKNPRAVERQHARGMLPRALPSRLTAPAAAGWTCRSRFPDSAHLAQKKTGASRETPVNRFHSKQLTPGSAPARPEAAGCCASARAADAPAAPAASEALPTSEAAASR